MQKTVSANGAYIPGEEINIKQVNDLKYGDCYFAGSVVYISLGDGQKKAVKEVNLPVEGVEGKVFQVEKMKNIIFVQPIYHEETLSNYWLSVYLYSTH